MAGGGNPWPTSSAIPVEQPTASPAGSVRPAKAKHQPSEGLASNRKQLAVELAGVCGVPVPLATGDGGAAAIREGQRIFANCLQSRADRITLDLAAGLKADVESDASSVFKTDIAMRARALKALVEAGMSVAEAREVTGV